MDEKFKEILEGAMTIFMRIGIRSVSIDDIAHELKIAKKTIYQYFKNKEEIVMAMLNLVIEKEEQSFHKLKEMTSNNAIDMLLGVSQEVSNNFKEVKPSHVFDLRKYYPRQFEDFWKIKRELVLKRIKDNLNQGVKENLFRNDMNIDLVADLYTRRLEEFHMVEDELYTKYSFDDIFKTMFENHIRGISNENGIKYFELKKKELNY